ncbi:MAG: N-acetylneuraminate synthase [Clostridia bacterium]|nr:N-acetylneuraminate synthase [Clostridia bacterium]
MTKKIEIVAEIGCNHGGDPALAKKMVKIAKDCGVDAVKFQTFNSELLISRYAPKAEYQKRNTGEKDSQLEMTRRLELSKQDLLSLWDYAKSLGLYCFSTPFDLESVEFLKSVNQHIWKIPAGEVTNLPYLERIGSFSVPDKKIILSSGMATVEELKTCINILVRSGTPEKDIIILHCNTEYPSPDEDINLSAIDHLKECFPNCEIGFSDHSVGEVAAIGAATKGIVMIEKHFTLDKNMEGPDHKASATPDELTALCKGVRRIETMLGVGKKIVTASESRNKIVARKSIVAARDIKKGEVFSEENLICKRPGNGISPMRWYDILGKTAEADFEQDRLIEASGFDWQGE